MIISMVSYMDVMQIYRVFSQSASCDLAMEVCEVQKQEGLLEEDGKKCDKAPGCAIAVCSEL